MHALPFIFLTFCLRADALDRELSRFPREEVCDAVVNRATKHEKLWRERVALGLCRHDPERVEAYCQRVHECAAVWHAVSWAHVNLAWARAYPSECEYHFRICREKLTFVHDMLGPELFAAGYLPYPIAAQWSRITGD